MLSFSSTPEYFSSFHILITKNYCHLFCLLSYIKQYKLCVISVELAGGNMAVIS